MGSLLYVCRVKDVCGYSEAIRSMRVNEELTAYLITQIHTRNVRGEYGVILKSPFLLTQGGFFVFMKSPREIIRQNIPVEWNENNISALMEEYAAQFHVQSPAEYVANVEAWKKLATSAYDVMSMFEKKPTRAELLKEIEQLKAIVPTEPALIPFSLERALAGDKVVTRDRREVKSVVIYSNRAFGNSIGCYINGEGCLYPENGIWDGTLHANDLFMAPRIVTNWVNFYRNGAANYFDSEERAKDAAENKVNYLRTVKITLDE